MKAILSMQPHIENRRTAMFTHATHFHVAGLKAQTVYEFLVNATDEDFQTWWPGTHLRYLTHKRCENHVGNVVYLDQYIGDYRVRAMELIVEAVSYRKIVRQIVKSRIRLPVRIVYDFADDDTGVSISHTIHAGFHGLGRLLDPGFRLYFSKRFMAAMDRHLVEEFELLRALKAAASGACR